MHTFFSRTLGTYDAAEAIRTVPAQLGYLHAFSELRRSDVVLVYRLAIEREPEGDLAPRFKVLCVGQTARSLNDEEARALQDHVAVALLPAWPLLWGSPAPLPGSRHRTRLLPSPRRPIPIKPDWAPLVDLLRRGESPVTVDLICACNPNPQPSTTSDLLQPSFAAGLSDVEREASNYFAAVGTEANQTTSLCVHATVHSDNPLDPLVAKTIGRALFGDTVTPRRIQRNIIFPSDPQACSISGSPEQIVRVFHPPYGHIEGRGLSGARSLNIPARFRVPDVDGVVLGAATRQQARHDATVPIRLSIADRRKHLYVLGKTGSGKTTLLKNLVRQDINSGHGVAVIDPHGALVDYALRHTGDRIDEVTLLDFSDPDYLPLFNPLLCDAGSPRGATLNIEELLTVLIHRSFNQFTGPVFDDTVRLMLSTASSLATDPMPESIVAAVELMRSESGRSWAAEALDSADPLLAEQWRTFNAMLPHVKAEHVRWVLSKFASFAPDGVLYGVTGATSSTLSFSSIFDRREILLVKIPESVVGPSASEVIGALTFARIHRAALAQLPKDDAPFHLYVDEFQKFVSADFEGLIAEARKFNLALTVAHQNLRQLDGFSRFEGASSPRLREALFSNVGSIVAMKVSGSDIHPLAQEFGIPDSELRRIRQYDGLARVVTDGLEREPFTLTVPLAEMVAPGDRRAPIRVKARMKRHGLWQRRSQLESTVEKSISRMRSEWTDSKAPPAGDAARKPSASHLDDFLNKRVAGPAKTRLSRPTPARTT